MTEESKGFLTKLRKEEEEEEEEDARRDGSSSSGSEEVAIEMDERFSIEEGDVQRRRRASKLAEAQIYDGEFEWPKESVSSHMRQWLDSEKDSLLMYAAEVKHDLATKEGALDILKKVKSNWRSGITVGLVNLPLSISLAIAASSVPTAGVVTAIWAGLFAALFGGCQFNIVGPTGALSGILAQSVAQYGPDSLSYLAIYAGLITLLVFILRWERYVLLVPSSVMEGFTLGVAFIIALNQLNFALGIPPLERHESVIENVVENLNHISQADVLSILTFLLVFGCLYALMWKWSKIPWVIIMCVFGIALSLILEKADIGFKYQTLKSRYGNLNMSLVDFPAFDKSYLSIGFISNAFSVAFVAILETLISAKIADGMTHTTFNQRREVFSLGIANVICGAVGGIPATAALARTALNIKTGATSRISAVLNTITVLILALALLWVFKYLPLPFVAAIIVLVAVRMVGWDTLLRFAKVDFWLFARTLMVAVICLFFDPTSGIVVGMILSLLLNADRLAHVHSEVVMKTKDGSSVEVRFSSLSLSLSLSLLSFLNDQMYFKKVVPDLDIHHKKHSSFLDSSSVPRVERHHQAVVYRFSGFLTYINAFDHKARLESFLSDYDVVILSFRYLYYLDVDGVDAITDVIESNSKEEFGAKILISGVNRSVYPLLAATKWFQDKKTKGEVFKTYTEALNSVEESSEEGSEMRRSPSNLFVSNL
ncbi:STAS domain-containing protein [Balamuthia mandrillaris]